MVPCLLRLLRFCACCAWDLENTQASPASRNVCGPDDAEQEVWELVQGLTPHQRRSRACTIVARLKEEVSGQW